MSVDPMIYVIMPTFDRAKLLPRAIQSVISQTYEKWNLIVINDGSKDNTREVFDKLLEVNENTKHKIDYVSYKKRRKVSAARNFGMQFINEHMNEHVIIAFLDSDNEFFPFYFKNLVEYLEPNGSYKAVYSRQQVVELDNKENIKKDYIRYYVPQHKLEDASYIDLNSFAHILELRQNFDEAMTRLVDWDYILRIADKTEIGFMDYVGSRYYMGFKDSISNTEPLGSNSGWLTRKRLGRVKGIQ